MSNKRKKHKKRSAVLPYLVTPIVFVLITLVFAIPASLGIFGFAKNYVHRAQSKLGMTIEEYGVDDQSYAPGRVTVGNVTVPEVKLNQKIGELSCEEAGVSCNVYYGSNRITRRNGAAVSSDSKLPGFNGVCEIKGTRSTYFKGVKNIEPGDKITLTTAWGIYVYSVSAVTVAEQPPTATMPQSLLLTCSADDGAFSNFGESRLYVLADCESGPQAEEVQYEQQ